MTPTLAKSLDQERFTTRLLGLMRNPTAEMIEAGKAAITESVVAEYIGSTAPKDILSAMLNIALKQAHS